MTDRQTSDKEPGAFRTISEVAAELDVPQHVLRFWETRFSQIRPLKRGGGRRFYRPEDVLLIRGVRRLLYGEGYTIRGVQRILKEEGVRYVQQIGAGDAPPAPAARPGEPAAWPDGAASDAPSVAPRPAAGDDWPPPG
ncbi:MerR family transcriptional regulator, partial [Camelimonas abortus]